MNHQTLENAIENESEKAVPNCEDPEKANPNCDGSQKINANYARSQKAAGDSETSENRNRPLKSEISEPKKFNT
jgi:hypothetical protein